MWSWYSACRARRLFPGQRRCRDLLRETGCFALQGVADVAGVGEGGVVARTSRRQSSLAVPSTWRAPIVALAPPGRCPGRSIRLSVGAVPALTVRRRRRRRAVVDPAPPSIMPCRRLTDQRSSPPPPAAHVVAGPALQIVLAVAAVDHVVATAAPGGRRCRPARRSHRARRCRRSGSPIGGADHGAREAPRVTTDEPPASGARSATSRTAKSAAARIRVVRRPWRTSLGVGSRCLRYSRAQGRLRSCASAAARSKTASIIGIGELAR